MTKLTSNRNMCAALAFFIVGWAGCSSTCWKPKDETDRVAKSSAALVVRQPEDIVVQEGTNAVFRVMAKEDSASFKWQFNGTDLPGQTKSWLEVSNVDYSKLGLYSCVVTVEKKSTVTHRAALFMFSLNSQGLLSSVQGPLRPCRKPITGECPAGHPVILKGIWTVTNSDTQNRWFPVRAGKTNCTVDTFDIANNRYDTVLVVTEQNNNDPDPSCNDDADDQPLPPLRSWLSELDFPVTFGRRYNFTIYTKQTPRTNPPDILKCNVTWSPP